MSDKQPSEQAVKLAWVLINPIVIQLQKTDVSADKWARIIDSHMTCCCGEIREAIERLKQTTPWVLYDDNEHGFVCAWCHYPMDVTPVKHMDVCIINKVFSFIDTPCPDEKCRGLAAFIDIEKSDTIRKDK